MNFMWNPNEHMWNTRLNELREFLKKYGHCIVLRTYNKFPKLGEWVSKVRRCMKNQGKETPLHHHAFLTAKQISDLDDLNFAWDLQEE